MMYRKITYLFAFMLMASFCAAQPVGINQADVKGKKQGKWIQFHENGKKRYEGSFKDDKPFGEFMYYYDNGAVSAALYYRNSGKRAKANAFHKNGKLMAQGIYIEEQKDSIWIYYDEQEKVISKESYVMGKKEGVSRTFYPGSGKLAEEKNWKKDVEHGKCVQYFESDTVKFKGEYVDGNLDGEIFHYYPDGKKKTTGNYKHAVKHGKWVYYKDDGRTMVQELYENGVLTKKLISEGFEEKKYE